MKLMDYMKISKKLEHPIIGISANILTIENGCFMGRERTFVGYDYVQAIKNAGGIPVVLPFVEGKEKISRQIELIDGLLLSGGQDIHPHHYGEEPSQRLEEVCPQRDIFEIELVRSAGTLNKPILGICRGLQLMNVAFGGSLFQDIPYAMPDALQHSQNANPEVATQTIELVEGTILQNLIGQSLLLANSYHHQAIKELAPGFRISARAKDGIVEAIEKEGNFFTLGVQWHPELMFLQHSSMQRLFQGFIEAARKRAEAE